MDGIHLPKKIGIIGGGITGLIVGIFLAKEGFKVTIYEKNKSLLTIFGGNWTTSPSIAKKIVTII